MRLFRDTGVTFVAIVLVALIIGGTGAFHLGKSAAEHAHRRTLETFAFLIGPQVSEWAYFGDERALLHIRQLLNLKAIELEVLSGQIYAPQDQNLPASAPSYTIPLLSSKQTISGELRIWCDGKTIAREIGVRAALIASTEILLGLMAVWILLVSSFRVHIVGPLKSLKRAVQLGAGGQAKAPTFGTYELDELSRAFWLCRSDLRKEVDEKARTLETLSREVSRRKLLTQAIESALEGAHMAMSYSLKFESGGLTLLGENLPLPLLVICRAFHSNGGDLVLAQRSAGVLTAKHPIYTPVRDRVEIELLTDGHWALQAIHLEAGGLALICMDVTAQVRARDHLIEARKMEALGLLTSGVAHDFNNILAIILGILEGTPEDGLSADALAPAQLAANRGVKLVRQLVDVSRRKPRRLVKVDQAAMLKGLVSTMQATLGPKHRLSIQIDTHEVIEAEEDLLETTMINLIVNACDAMPDGGEVYLRSFRPSETVWRDEGLCSDAFVGFEVRDQGEGLSSETLNRIFDPFFTSKGTWHGSGLGLPMAQAFSTRSGGHISCHSALGEGTAIRMFLPIAASHPVVHDPVQPQPRAGLDMSSRSMPRVLLVDDEVSLIGISSGYLRAKGCHVDCAEGVSEAKCALDVHVYDVVVTDMYMPDGTGIDLAREIRRRGLETRIILVSGNVDVAHFTAEEAEMFEAVMEKPYRMSMIHQSILAPIEQSEVRAANTGIYEVTPP